MELLGRSVDATAEISAAVDAAAQSVAHAVRSPWARVELDGQGEAPEGAAILPLTAGDERLGTLVVAPRRPGESYSRRDLDQLAWLRLNIGRPEARARCSSPSARALIGPGWSNVERRSQEWATGSNSSHFRP